MILRYLVLSLTYAAIIIWVIYLLKCRKKWLYALAPLLWLINAGAFWTYRLLIDPAGLNPSMLNDWSAGIYLHVMITLVGAGVIAVWEGKRC